jgi:glutathione S-transferase
MKLYYSPFACSLSPHIALREAGLEFELERVDKNKRTQSGEDYLAVNPKGYVPALRLDSGEVLTEGPVIVQYIADLRPDSGLAPQQGTFERYRLQEWLMFISTELHKQFSPLFAPTTPQEMKPTLHANIKKRVAFLDERLKQHCYLLGDRFSVADGYAFVVLNWARTLRVDLDAFERVKAYQERIAQRPAVQAALERERQKA